MSVHPIEEPAFLVTGKAVRTSQANNIVPQFWQQCEQDGTVQRICQLADGKVTDSMMLGVCFDSQPDGSFQYLVGVETQAAPPDQDLVTIEIPASSWLVFESIGAMPDAILAVWHHIFSEDLPASGFHAAGTPELEVYYPGDTCADDYRSEVWIPVVRK